MHALEELVTGKLLGWVIPFLEVPPSETNLGDNYLGCAASHTEG